MPSPPSFTALLAARCEAAHLTPDELIERVNASLRKSGAPGTLTEGAIRQGIVGRATLCAIGEVLHQANGALTFAEGVALAAPLIRGRSAGEGKLGTNHPYIKAELALAHACPDAFDALRALTPTLRGPSPRQEDRAYWRATFINLGVPPDLADFLDRDIDATAAGRELLGRGDVAEALRTRPQELRARIAGFIDAQLGAGKSTPFTTAFDALATAYQERATHYARLLPEHQATAMARVDEFLRLYAEAARPSPPAPESQWQARSRPADPPREPGTARGP